MYRQLGKDGHYDIEDYADQAIVHKTKEHASNIFFGEEGLKNKKEAYQQMFKEVAPEQMKNASKAEALTLDEVLASIQKTGLSSTSAACRRCGGGRR